MDPLAFPIFTLIFKLVVTQFDGLMSSVNGEFVRSISLIALVVETLYITHYGFLIAFELRTESSDEANLTELLYHIVVVIVVLGLLNAPAGVTPLDAFMALRRLLMLGLIGDASGSLEPIGEQVHTALGNLDSAFSVGSTLDTVLRAANSTSVMLDTPQLKSTAVTLALVSDISPQISAGILLLLNELMVRLGIALFPLVFYGILYDVSRGFFYTWLEVMFSASIQLSVSLVLIKAAVIVTGVFVTIFTGLGTAGLLAGSSSVGGAVISELQASVIQAGFGLTLSALLFWVPTNMASFAGKIINDSVLKQSLGTAVTARGVHYVRRANQVPRTRTTVIPNVFSRSLSRNDASLSPSNRRLLGASDSSQMARQISQGVRSNNVAIPALITIPRLQTVRSDSSVFSSSSSVSSSSVSSSSISTVAQDKDRKIPAVIRIVSKMDSKPPALVKGSMQIPLARTLRFGAGSDDETSSTRLTFNVGNNPTNYDFQLDVRLFMQKIKSDRTPRTIRNAEGQWVPYGANGCWFASLKMLNSYHSPVVAPIFLKSNTEASNKLKNILVKDKGIPLKDIKLLAKVEKLTFLDNQYINIFSIESLSKALKQYGPIWAPFKRIKLKSGAHVVVITGVKGNSIVFNDPSKIDQQTRPSEWFYERILTTHQMILVKNTAKDTANNLANNAPSINNYATNLRFGAGSDDDSLSSNDSVDSLKNTRGIHDKPSNIPVILTSEIRRAGLDYFLDEFGNRTLPAQAFQKSDGGLCWAAAMAMTGYINTSRSPPSYINTRIEFYEISIDKLLKNYKNFNGFSTYDLIDTQDLMTIPEYVGKLTPKNLKKLLNKYEEGIYASIFNGMINGNKCIGGHAVLVTGVKGDKLIYNDPNREKEQEVTFDKFNKALKPNEYSLFVRKNTFTISSSITTNRYTSGINLKDAPNDKIYQHITDLGKKYDQHITNATNTNSSEVLKETLYFKSLLAQVDEVVRPRYKKAFEKDLVTSLLAELKGINDPSLLLTDPTMSQIDSEKLMHSITTKNDTNKNILLEGLNNLNQIHLNKLSENDFKNTQHHINLYLNNKLISNIYKDPANKIINMSSQERSKELVSFKNRYISRYEELNKEKLSLFGGLELVTNYSVVFTLVYEGMYRNVESRLKKIPQKTVVHKVELPFNPKGFSITINKNAKTKEEKENNITLIHTNNLKIFDEIVKNNNLLLAIEAADIKRQLLQNNSDSDDNRKSAAVDKKPAATELRETEARLRGGSDDELAKKMLALASSTTKNDVQLKVPLIEQGIYGANACWYASAKMVNGYHAPNAAPNILTERKASFRATRLNNILIEDRGLLVEDMKLLAKVEGLKPLSRKYVGQLSAENVSKLLVKKGPIWAAYSLPEKDYGHTVVITGVKGNSIIYNDPWKLKVQSESFEWFNKYVTSNSRYSLLVKDTTKDSRKVPAVIRTVSKTDSKPPAVVGGSVQIPLARTLRFGAGSSVARRGSGDSESSIASQGNSKRQRLPDDTSEDERKMAASVPEQNNSVVSDQVKKIFAKNLANADTNQKLKEFFEVIKKNHRTSKAKHKHIPDYVDKSYLYRLNKIQPKTESIFENTKIANQLKDEPENCVEWLEKAKAINARIEDFSEIKQIEIRSLIVSLKLNQLVLSDKSSTLEEKELRQSERMYKIHQSGLFNKLITAAPIVTVINNDNTTEDTRKMVVSVPEQDNTVIASSQSNNSSDMISIDAAIYETLVKIVVLPVARRGNEDFASSIETKDNFKRQRLLNDTSDEPKMAASVPKQNNILVSNRVKKMLGKKLVNADTNEKLKELFKTVKSNHNRSKTTYRHIPDYVDRSYFYNFNQIQLKTESIFENKKMQIN